MPKTPKTRISADEIAEKASRGEDVSAHFTNKFTLIKPVRGANLDLEREAPRNRKHRKSPPRNK